MPISRSARGTSRAARHRGGHCGVGSSRAPAAGAPMLVACGAVLVAALCLQLLAFGHGGHDSISDIPRLVLARGVDLRHWPYVSRVLEYPVLAGVLLGSAVSIGSGPLGAL